MKFFVTRTSYLPPGEKPCEDAISHDDEWIVEIETIEDLQAFVEKNGSIVVGKYVSDDLFSIEIYDTYRE